MKAEVYTYKQYENSQENTTSQKKSNYNSPATGLKSTELLRYNWQRFKIAVTKTLNEVQENLEKQFNEIRDKINKQEFFT